MQAFTVVDEDDAERSYSLELESGQGWAITSSVPATLTLAPGGAGTYSVEVFVPADAPLGAGEETTLTAARLDELFFADTATAVTVSGFRVALPVVQR